MTQTHEFSPLSAEPNPGLPSGYALVEQLPQRARVGADTLPWVTGEQDLSVARCVLQSGEEFLLANAVGTHPKLIRAADGMSPQQEQNANNMFYSRLPEIIQNGHSPTVEVMGQPVTDFPIRVMRNRGGQRVYFGIATVPMTDGSEQRLVMRLGACDKNRQGVALSVLSGMSEVAHRRTH